MRHCRRWEFSLEISIVIPTHRRAFDLAFLLESLLKQEFTGKFETIVVSNVVDRDTERVVDRFSKRMARLSYRVVGRVGVNFARNVGIQNSRGDILLFLDDDVRLFDRNYLQNIAAAHKDLPSATGIGGPYRLLGNKSSLSWAYQYTCEFWLRQSVLLGSKTTNLVGGNASYKRSFLGKHLRFSEEIQFGGAETQFNARLWRSGHELHFLEHLVVGHDASVSVVGFLSRAFKQGRTRKRILLENKIPEIQMAPARTDRLHQLRNWGDARHQGYVIRFWLFCFDWFFALGFEVAEIALTEDRRERIWATLVLNRIRAKIARVRQLGVFWDIVQSVHFAWPQRARFSLASTDDKE